MRFLVSLLALLLAMGPAFAGLEWETLRRDVRPAAGEKVVAVSFPFRNSGDAPVKITGIQTSCGCTSAKADLTDIPAGASGAVEVRFTVGRRTGEQIKGIIVRTSDKQKHKLLLRVELPER